MYQIHQGCKNVHHGNLLNSMTNLLEMTPERLNQCLCKVHELITACEQWQTTCHLNSVFLVGFFRSNAPFNQSEFPLHIWLLCVKQFMIHKSKIYVWKIPMIPQTYSRVSFNSKNIIAMEKHWPSRRKPNIINCLVFQTMSKWRFG